MLFGFGNHSPAIWSVGMSVPLKDTLLVPYVKNFSRLLTEAGETYHVTAEQAAAFSVLADAYLDAMGTLVAQRERGMRSAPQTSVKESTKADLLPVLRSYYALIQNSLDISNDSKLAIGVHVPKGHKTRSHAPAERPGVGIESVFARSIAISIYPLAASNRRGKVANATHAYVWSFVGKDYPADRADWRFHGEARTNRFELTLPPAVPSGAQVWVSASWVSARGEVGPPSNPVMTNIQGGGALPATTMQLAA